MRSPLHAATGLLGGLILLASGARALEIPDQREPATANRSPLALSRTANGTRGMQRTALPGPAKRAAIERGLSFLASQQAHENDGSIPAMGAEPARLAVTSLGALAYMSAGNTPGRGPYGAQVTRAIDYLLTKVDLDSTSRTRGYISDSADRKSKLHGHGFATLALAEAYSVSPGSDRGARMRYALEVSLALMEKSQGIEGAWFYDPVRGIQHEGSVTIALVQAMRAAKGAGLHVNPKVISRAVDYVRRSQREDGAFRYALGDDNVSVALTAAAISTLNATGRYHGPEIQQGFDSIQRELTLRADGAPAPGFRPDRSRVAFPFYERLYLAQAYWQNPDQAVFERWFATEAKNLLRSQREDGSWEDARFGATYATAMNVLVLAIPDQLLPIFQR